MSVDTIRMSIYFHQGNTDVRKPYHPQINWTIYQALLNNSFQKQKGFVVNSTTGIMECQDLWRAKVNSYKNHEMIIVNGTMKVPSWDYNINWRVFEDRIDCEFSLPKFIYSTNVIELRQHLNSSFSNPYDLTRLALKKFFELFFFGHRVNYAWIKISRWDFCYNQCFYSREESLKALQYIKLKHEKKGDTKNYEFGYVELSKRNYFKIYHKGEEFRKHDRLKLGTNQDQFQRMADKILRYERKVTAKSVSYWYNTKYKHHETPFLKDLVKQYLKDKRENTLTKAQKTMFETTPLFVFEKHPTYNMLHSVLLDKIMFNDLYYKFRTEIEKKFSIGKMSIERLSAEVMNKEDKKGKAMKVKILAFIKIFGSLKRAEEKGAISTRTRQRYDVIMLEKGLSTTKIDCNIKQDFQHYMYHRELLHQNINVNLLTKDIRF